MRSGGPSPVSAWIASSISSALPTARPSGRSIAVSSATVGQSWLWPMPIISFASASSSSSVVTNDPLPRLTSSTRPSRPSASFLLMMLAAMSGIESTVAVALRNAYILRSAGAISLVWPIITQWIRSSCRRASTNERSVRKPGMDSSLSRVPPVCPSPRPDIMGTASPAAAINGARTIDTLSPTPPIECLSTAGRSSPDVSSRDPLSSIASVSATVSEWSNPRR